MDNRGFTFRQANAYAMQYGLFLGLWGIVSLAVVVISLSMPGMPALSFVSTAMMVGSLIVAARLTSRYRKLSTVPGEGFSFGRGFMFTFMTGLYASLCIALVVYVYLAYFDHGYVFNAYERMLQQPEFQSEFERSGMSAQLDAMTAGRGATALVDAMRAMPPSAYAVSIIYLTIISAPFISVVIALINRRKAQRPNL